MIEIKITADTTAEVLRDLAKLSRTFPVGTLGGSAKEDRVLAPTTAEPEPATVMENVESAACSAASEDATAETAPTAPEATTKKLTLEGVRAAGVNVAKKHGKETVKGILDSLGEVGMASMDPSNYEEFMRKLGELDA